MTLSRQRTSRLAGAIVTASVVAGVFDILFAFAASSVGPVRVLQSVASGLLGPAAFEGGGAGAALGLLLHFLMMLLIAAIFGLAAARLPILVRRAALAGAAYGFGVYWVMNLIVIPLSRTPFGMPEDPARVTLGVIGHMALIGLPIAVIIARALRPPPTA